MFSHLCCFVLSVFLLDIFVSQPCCSCRFLFLIFLLLFAYSFRHFSFLYDSCFRSSCFFLLLFDFFVLFDSCLTFSFLWSFFFSILFRFLSVDENVHRVSCSRAWNPSSTTSCWTGETSSSNCWTAPTRNWTSSSQR